MLNVKTFVQKLNLLNFNFYSGVPCSFLGGLPDYLINKKKFLMSTNEGEAVSICAGASLANKKSVILIQNSGLTNAISPLTSLNHTFKIPLLGFIGLRGHKTDEPQHRLVHDISKSLLNLMEIKNEVLSDDIHIASKQLTKANNYIKKNKSFFFLVKKNTFEKIKLDKQNTKITKRKIFIQSKKIEMNTRFEVLKKISSLATDNMAIMCTTGKTGRELHDINDVKNNFYMVGSMGNVSSIALGTALNSKKKIIAIDGDGSLLMKMGNLATNSFYGPKNFFHLLLDNHMHDSTGGQFTVSKNMDFLKIAYNSGYNKSFFIHSLDDLKKKIELWKKKPSLTFAYMKILPGSIKNLGRPKLRPDQVKQRFMKFLNN